MKNEKETWERTLPHATYLPDVLHKVDLTAEVKKKKVETQVRASQFILSLPQPLSDKYGSFSEMTISV